MSAVELIVQAKMAQRLLEKLILYAHVWPCDYEALANIHYTSFL